MRINKYLAQSGVASRRKAEDLIVAGKVKVNGKVVTNLATDIKSTDIVSIDNHTLHATNNFVYYKLNKPKGYVTTVSDDKGRKTVMELLRAVHHRVFPVGRLDYDSEGLLIMTNDGDLTNILTRPSSEIEKTYTCHIESGITKDEIKKLTEGVDIGDCITRPCSIELVEYGEKLSKLKVKITEGKNRQIRKMFESIGKNVIFLKRTQIGEIRLGGLSRGEYAPLNGKEMKYLNSLKK
ncbi:MAG: rRNA pseudouridine synthase [Clostridia bacterium]|nr:rRNA pseudouridine synthase [Clostridia bacterium]